MLQDDVELEPYERIVASVLARPAPQVFTAAWAEGRSMTPEQAVTFVLAPA